MSTNPPAPATPASTAAVGAGTPTRRRLGIGRVLITVYAILAIGAVSRAVFQIAKEYSRAPIPITLSALSGLIYVVATLALILPGRTWYRIAWITITFELVGVLVVGTLSVFDATFAGAGDVSDGTVWSYFGRGYLFIPVVLPILGMIWLRSRRTQPDLVSAKATNAGGA